MFADVPSIPMKQMGFGYGIPYPSDYLRALFECKRADPQDDLVTGLVLAREAGDALSGDEKRLLQVFRI